MTPTEQQEAIERLRDLDAKRSQGEWRLREEDGRKNQCITIVEEIVSEYSPTKTLVTLSATIWRPERGKVALPNARFIAALANNALPIITSLQSENTRLTAENEDMRRRLGIARGCLGELNIGQPDYEAFMAVGRALVATDLTRPLEEI